MAVFDPPRNGVSHGMASLSHASSRPRNRDLAAYAGCVSRRVRVEAGSLTVQAALANRARMRLRPMLFLLVALPHVFDMFHQAPTDASTSGVGLGLYIVRRFVELLGGRVSASSRPGDGSIFRLSLPAGVVMQPQPVSMEEHRRRKIA